MSAHRHFDIDTGEEIFVPVGDCYRCELNRGEEADHQAEYIEELEVALKRIAEPDPDDTVENLAHIAREVLDER